MTWMSATKHSHSGDVDTVALRNDAKRIWIGFGLHDIIMFARYLGADGIPSRVKRYGGWAHLD